ncbi:acetylglutamate kinase [Albibacterium profundi]|uniref:Acetylglutamate kinase n=1 Tax=Albibacterium profundi TaxID=3134906 RepID=A0ABV5CDD6_9SPHI
MNKDKLRIIKIGGNIIDSPSLLTEFLSDFNAIEGKKILVHGGGKIATDFASKMGIEAKMVEGRRITDEAMLDIVTMVYAGLVNKKVVAQLQATGCNAVGLSGADANSIRVIKRPVKSIDYGLVGDIQDDSVDTHTLSIFLENGLVPVFSAITHDGKGQLLNTNADTIASSIATALSTSYSVSLIYCFEKKGVLRDVNDEKSLVTEIKREDFDNLQREGVIAGGMIPKLHNAFDAIDKGVCEVLVGQASDLKFVDSSQFGTRIIK